MNPKYFGDSYDIVKRFFIGLLKEAGFAVYVEPMFTGSWQDNELRFLSFLGAIHIKNHKEERTPSALLVDPDTGINDRASAKHCSLTQLMSYAKRHEIVFAFDQSFSYSQLPKMQMKMKLDKLRSLGMNGFYYDSHARFLFLSNESTSLSKIQDAILASGLPKHRLVYE